jgi:uncharacterized cupin superfamily protein
MRRANLSRVEIVRDEGDPPGYDTGYARIGPVIGAAKLGMTLYELPPGQSICPYHYEYPHEEWAIVLEGRPTLRDPEGEHALEPQDVVCFPAGPDGAHKLTNDTGDTVRVLLLSTKGDPSVAVYPDSAKLGFWSGNKEDGMMVRRESGVEYWDRET